MFSRLDRRAGWNFSLRLVARNSILFILAAVAFYFATRRAVADALEGQWDVRTASVQASWSASHRQVSEEVSLHVGAATAELSAALRQHVENRFRGLYVWVAAGLVIASALGGLLFTYRATAPTRRIVRTVVEILETGDLDRRVDAEGVRGTPLEIVGLFNRLFDRVAALIRAIHDTLDHVGHDLRTPMTRLRATAEKALERADDPAACRDAVADCLEESDRALTMLNTLMEVAEAETGAMRLSKERVDLEEVVRDVTDLYSIVAEERGAKLATRIESRPSVRADPTRLRQALANLVDNALKYGGKGNTVTITLDREGSDAVLSVKDTGPGIPVEEQPRIWERLYRGEKGKDERGLGLGLSFVRAIVEAHDGKVEVSSTVGEGATFRIRLPLAPP
jgi:signal transduction histidine kinase